MIPALIAGGVAAASLISNYYNSKADQRSRANASAKLDEQRIASDNEYAQMLRDIDSYYNGRGSLGTAQDVTSYKDAIAGYDPNQFVYDRGEFGYNKTADDFITPLRDKIVANEVAGVQHSAAGAGLGRGSGAAEAIAQAVADKDLELYKTAQADYRDDRDFAYKKYSDYAAAMQNKLDTLRAATDTKIALQGNLANDYYNVMDAAQADRIRAKQDKLATDATYAQAMAGLA